MALPWGVSCHSLVVLLFSGFRCLENGYWTWPWLFLSSISFSGLLFGRKGRAVCWVMCWGVGLQCGYVSLPVLMVRIRQQGSFLVNSGSLGLSRLLGTCWAQWRPAACRLLGAKSPMGPPPFPTPDSQRNSWFEGTKPWHWDLVQDLSQRERFWINIFWMP